MQTVSLTDIVPAPTTVEVAGNPVEVLGVSIEGVAHLLGKFPMLRELIAGRQSDVTAEDLIRVVPAGAAAIIAAGVGKPGDEATEIAAARIPLESQLDLLEAILALTLPRGLGPFVERLSRLGALVQVAPLAGPQDSGQAPKSRKPSRP